MDTLRKPFQGLTNIIIFNWHFYLIGLFLILIGIISSSFLSYPFQIILLLLIALAIISVLISIAVSYYIYDLSDLYKLPWLKINNQDKLIANIHAGFDETSSYLQQKFEGNEVLIYDFYNPQKHTEVSIKRARRKYPNDPKTKVIKTDFIPLDKNSVDKIFVLLAAHEIRNEKERIAFFKELKRVVKPNGKIYVMEHLRDIQNFVAFNIGFLHFHSLKSWKQTFKEADLTVINQIKCTPFISTFILH